MPRNKLEFITETYEKCFGVLERSGVDLQAARKQFTTLMVHAGVTSEDLIVWIGSQAYVNMTNRRTAIDKRQHHVD